MLKIRIASPAHLTNQVVRTLESDGAVSSLSLMRGASLRPIGDIIHADVPREAANEVIDELRALGVHEEGTVHVEPVSTWLSRRGLDTERAAPGSGTDAVVWAEVTQRAYEDSQLNWTFLSFITMATLIAGIAIILDSQILIIGAMVLGPEFGAVAALGLAFVRGRGSLFATAAATLFIGFVVAIAVTAVAALIAYALGWLQRADVTDARPATDFIYSPDKWSFIVAVIAGAAGVLSLTSARVAGLSGVFISVTTIPAAGNIALAIATGVPQEMIGSAAQLLLNLTGMAFAGWLALVVQTVVWRRIAVRRLRLRQRLDRAAEDR